MEKEPKYVWKSMKVSTYTIDKILFFWFLYALYVKTDIISNFARTLDLYEVQRHLALKMF